MLEPDMVGVFGFLKQCTLKSVEKKIGHRRVKCGRTAYKAWDFMGKKKECRLEGPLTFGDVPVNWKCKGNPFTSNTALENEFIYSAQYSAMVHQVYIESLKNKQREKTSAPVKQYMPEFKKMDQEYRQQQYEKHLDDRIQKLERELKESRKRKAEEIEKQVEEQI